MYEFNNQEPIYLQLIEIIKSQIVSGELKEDEKICSVRELAVQYGVNPNTVQKALSELEREGLIRTERTSGRYVAISSDKSFEVKNDFVNKQTNAYVNKMKSLSLTDKEIISEVKKALIREENSNV